MVAESEDRLVTQRTNYLARSTELRDTEAEAIAWSEWGYTRSAIARKLDTSKSTVKGWHERAMAQYGLEICETLRPEQLQPPLAKPSYEPVGADYLDELESHADRERWAECVERNADSLPQEWANDVIDALEERGYYSIS